MKQIMLIKLSLLRNKHLITPKIQNQAKPQALTIVNTSKKLTKKKSHLLQRQTGTLLTLKLKIKINPTKKQLSILTRMLRKVKMSLKRQTKKQKSKQNQENKMKSCQNKLAESWNKDPDTMLQELIKLLCQSHGWNLFLQDCYTKIEFFHNDELEVRYEQQAVAAVAAVG